MLKKIIALTVMIVFFCVIGTAAYPLHAQELPGAVEQAGKAGVHSGGSSIFPIVLIIIGIGALAAVFFLILTKTSYDVTGSWVFILGNKTGSETIQVDFAGTSNVGAWSVARLVPPMGGSYTANDKILTMTMTSISSFIGSGRFTNKDTMTGTWATSDTYVTWTATRGTTTTRIDTNQPQHTQLAAK